MRLIEKIEQAKRMADAMANCTSEKHKKFVWNHMITQYKELFQQTYEYI